MHLFDRAATGVTGQPILWYEGIGLGAAARRYLSADERGSIISVSDSSGTTFGGAFGTGTTTEAELTSGIWMNCR